MFHEVNMNKKITIKEAEEFFDEHVRDDIVSLMVNSVNEISTLRDEKEKYKNFLINLNNWFGENPNWDLGYEPPWYQEMLRLMN